MLIDKFTFQTDFLFYKKHAKCQLSIFFNFHFSSVHFIGVFYRQERRLVEFA